MYFLWVISRCWVLEPTGCYIQLLSNSQSLTQCARVKVINITNNKKLQMLTKLIFHSVKIRNYKRKTDKVKPTSETIKSIFQYWCKSTVSLYKKCQEWILKLYSFKDRAFTCCWRCSSWVHSKRLWHLLWSHSCWNQMPCFQFWKRTEVETSLHLGGKRKSRQRLVFVIFYSQS